MHRMKQSWTISLSLGMSRSLIVPKPQWIFKKGYGVSPKLFPSKEQMLRKIKMFLQDTFPDNPNNLFSGYFVSQMISISDDLVPFCRVEWDRDLYSFSGCYAASQVALVVKNPPANAGDMRRVVSISGVGRSSGIGNGNPLQCACLENPMDRGAWQATVHGVAKSQTWLSDWAHKNFSSFTLLYVKQITSGNLLSDAGSSNLVLCDNLERWDGLGGGKEVQEGGAICMADSCWCMAENQHDIVKQLFSN